jgi:hypothetical protein
MIEPFKATHRHKKRKSEYQVVHSALMQTAQCPVLDDAVVVVYRDALNNWYVRPVQEFKDGRFEELQ